MSSTALKIDISMIKRLQERINSPTLKAQIAQLPHDKGVAALVSQAIADNFSKEGPGWAPLKAKTIRASVSKKKKKEISEMSDNELLQHESKARLGGPAGSSVPHRQILQKTGFLKKVATTPGVSGTNNTGIQGSNTYRIEGTNLVWGVDLVYAKTHNEGNPKQNIPKRQFLVVHDDWMKKINMFMAGKIVKLVAAAIKGGY